MFLHAADEVEAQKLMDGSEDAPEDAGGCAHRYHAFMSIHGTIQYLYIIAEVTTDRYMMKTG